MCGFPNGYENAKSIHAGTEYHAATALDKEYCKIEQITEDHVRPTILLGGGVIERRRNTHDHRACNVVINAPAGVESPSVKLTFRREESAVVEHTQNFAAQKKSHHGHKICEIGFIDLLEIYGEVEIKIREGNRKDLCQSEQHGVKVIIGGKETAKYVSNAERNESPDKLRELSAFFVRDDVEHQSADCKSSNDGNGDEQIHFTRVTQKDGGVLVIQRIVHF